MTSQSFILVAQAVYQKKKKKKEGTVSRLFLSIKIFIRSSTRMMMTEIVSQGLVIKKSDELNQASIPRILTYER